MVTSVVQGCNGAVASATRSTLAMLLRSGRPSQCAQHDFRCAHASRAVRRNFFTTEIFRCRRFALGGFALGLRAWGWGRRRLRLLGLAALDRKLELRLAAQIVRL